MNANLLTSTSVTVTATKRKEGMIAIALEDSRATLQYRMDTNIDAYIVINVHCKEPRTSNRQKQ